MEALTIHPQNRKQLKAIKIPFEKKDSPYDPEFVKMIQDAEKEKEGAITLNNDEDIDNYFKNLEDEIRG